MKKEVEIKEIKTDRYVDKNRTLSVFYIDGEEITINNIDKQLDVSQELELIEKENQYIDMELKYRGEKIDKYFLINKNMSWAWCVKGKDIFYTEIYRASGINITRDFKYVELVNMEHFIQLDNGDFLYNDFGKYASGITFVLEKPVVNWKSIKNQDLNLAEGSYKFILGDYWKSRKGSDCFRPKTNGKHILLRDSWGGAFNDYRGYSLPEDGLYYNRARSNGGGSGNDYAIFRKDWCNTLSIEDI